jgi:hypothetical protein
VADGIAPINGAPVIKDAPPEINENESLFTFRTPVTLVEPTIATASSSLLKPINHTSKNPFSFFNTLANPTISIQPFNSSLPALPKPVETYLVSASGAIGAVVTGMLAVGYWAWKKVKSNNSTATIEPYKARLMQ